MRDLGRTTKSVQYRVSYVRQADKRTQHFVVIKSPRGDCVQLSEARKFCPTVYHPLDYRWPQDSDLGLPSATVHTKRYGGDLVRMKDSVRIMNRTTTNADSQIHTFPNLRLATLEANAICQLSITHYRPSGNLSLSGAGEIKLV